jgi:hypothetical protein
VTRAASAFGAAAARDKGCPRPRAVAVVVARRIAEDDDVEVDIVTEDIISLSLSRARACEEGDVHGGGRHVTEGCIGWLNPSLQAGERAGRGRMTTKRVI